MKNVIVRIQKLKDEMNIGIDAAEKSIRDLEGGARAASTQHSSTRCHYGGQTLSPAPALRTLQRTGRMTRRDESKQYKRIP